MIRQCAYEVPSASAHMTMQVMATPNKSGVFDGPSSLVSLLADASGSVATTPSNGRVLVVGALESGADGGGCGGSMSMTMTVSTLGWAEGGDGTPGDSVVSMSGSGGASNGTERGIWRMMISNAVSATQVVPGASPTRRETIVGKNVVVMMARIAVQLPARCQRRLWGASRWLVGAPMKGHFTVIIRKDRTSQAQMVLIGSKRTVDAHLEAPVVN